MGRIVLLVAVLGTACTTNFYVSQLPPADAGSDVATNVTDITNVTDSATIADATDAGVASDRAPDTPTVDTVSTDVSVGDTGSSCGALGQSCCDRDSGPRCDATLVCSTGRCMQCPDGLLACRDSCVLLSTSHDHCGRCDNRCADRETCVGGSCTLLCPSPLSSCDGRCVATLSDPANCGNCRTTCATGANATAVCTSGTCGLICSPGFADCDRNASNGCETPLNTTANCGACGAICNLPNANESCTNGACAVNSCTAYYGDCDGLSTNGCETDWRTSTPNCGGCGNACRAGLVCQNGNCRDAVQNCPTGWGDCNATPGDGVRGDGCETDLHSPTNCGACGAACSLSNATARCPAGVCEVASCTMGRGNCNNVASDGCETDLNTSLTHCGACGTECRLDNASTVCTGGHCNFTACTAGWGNCDGIPNSACETDLNTSLTHCGACGRACSPANATGMCTAGVCAIARCNPGFGDCDGSAANGCETRLNTTTNCGACGSVCAPANANATCASGTCAVMSCTSGWANCNGSVSDGCETSLMTDGANCGVCGRACGSGRVCRSGVCGTACPLGQSQCGSSCVDLQNDRNHCGSCTNVCSDRDNATVYCREGGCHFECDSSHGDCDGNANNGCETDTRTSVNNCRACGVVCPTRAHSRPYCERSVCLLRCDQGWDDCDGDPANGCETDLSNPNNCGRCNNSCPSRDHSRRTCVNAQCGIACDTGWGNCNSDITDGCETPLNTRTNCGRCGGLCIVSGGPVTSIGVCCPNNNPLAPTLCCPSPMACMSNSHPGCYTP